ncbi:MAG: type II secretion system F family protein [Candidatus Omnitrophota bacterium]
MPYYKYRAKSGPEDIIEGHLEARNEKEALEKLNQQGYAPLELSEQAWEKKPRKGAASMFSRNVASHDVTLFSRQLSSFMKAGVPILRSLTVFAEQSRNSRLRVLYESIRDDVKDGKSLSQALTRFGRIFGPLYIAMVRAGEDSGTLPEVFERMADYRQKQEDVIAKVRMALVYPALMALVAVGTISFMLVFVLPRLTQIFSTMGEDLPVVTKILIALSAGLRQWWPGILLGLALIGLVIYLRVRTPSGARTLSRLKLTIPVFGTLSLQAELASFTRTLELLIRNGIPVLKALEVAIPTVNNEMIKQELIRSAKDLEQGASFGRSLEKSKIFPAFMVNLIMIGEESGRLEEALVEIMNAYEKDTDAAIKVMTTLLEPAVILVMGLVVGFVVIAMLLPVFQINLMIH